MISCSDCYFLLHVELGFDLEVEGDRVFQLNWAPVSNSSGMVLLIGLELGF